MRSLVIVGDHFDDFSTCGLKLQKRRRARLSFILQDGAAYRIDNINYLHVSLKIALLFHIAFDLDLSPTLASLRAGFRCIRLRNKSVPGSGTAGWSLCKTFNISSADKIAHKECDRRPVM